MLRLTVGLTLVTLVACLQCPNNEECAAGQSCCQDPTGEFTCCPFHHGECCEDHIHCCPEGMLCNVLDFTCVNATHTLPSVERIPAKQSDFPKSFRMIPSLPASEDDITCPDGSFCPAEFSCLLMASSYGCCPVAQGLVCSDGKHCCPKGHECSADSSSCVKQKEQVETVICGDGKSECPVDTTCCETEDGQWACCPMPKAVCCDDKIHCCPEDSVCDVEGSKCMSSTNQELPMWAKFPARLRAEWEDHKPAEMRAEAKVTTTRQITTAGNQMTTLPGALREHSDVPCNDTKSCPDGSTCCKTKDGGWACCPLPEAVCCDDFIHCCPHGKTCNVAAGSCDDPSGSTPWLEKLPVQSKNVAVKQGSSDVPCNDTSACPDGSTCCKTKDGGWACCPLPEAVCCDDFIHCCPHGKTCNVAAGSCDDPSGSTPWLEKLPVQRKNVAVTQVSSDVPCNDTSACPDGSTCCKTKDGGWACCPLPEAVCCEDFTHCCPHGKICNVAAGTCEDPSCSGVPWVKQVPVQPVISQNVTDKKNSDVPCNDTKSCPDGSTCCKTKDGGWACCPLPEAVCCDDFIHCCPHGKTCNVAAGSCDDPSGSTPWLEKLPVQRKNVAVKQGSSDVPCDDTSACPDGSTCCKTKDGGWACCPLPEAVCCDDFIHCCPHGKTCNVAAGSCDGPSGSTPWLEKLPVQRKNVAVTQVSSDVPCDDTSACPDGSTCCKTKDGGWACCPLPEAVCCDDFIHCCPHGKTCNVAAGSCDDPSGSSPWLEKVPARPRAGQRSTKNMNCDSSHICPESNTCCKNIDGDWGCCPLPEAVCCRDRFHCCPHGTTCNLVTLTCNGNTTSVPMSVINSSSDKEEQRQHKKVKEEVGKYIRVPCDAHTSCPDHTTCCLIAKTNKWGCCPLPNAVCCTDGEHCCPAHYKCDVSRVSCIKGDVVIPWYNKIAAQSSLTPNSDLSTNKCDEQSSCSTDSTCCRLTTGEWGCCPLPQAVCCPDQQHCCPRGYKCDLRRHSCIKTTWLYVERVPLAHIGVQKPQPSVSGKDIQCGGGYTCQDGQTCCPTSQTTWGCCPSSMAECCDDMKHCCPAGYKCGTGGICTPAVGFDWNNWDSWRVFFSKKKRATTL
ncbi:granulin a isoform X40 [Ctenopharyngodon idella]|uniref:granulin a isoform X38 n=1 Tax=Ctenopharyngodon idella TaxID=7959 RepID=UPI00222E4A5F|nr:granulin a isoform X38 [Ctenopharyngodon idella]XP_051745683.1 granulin a isoform X40 [Ctenopharyngodon idella]